MDVIARIGSVAVTLKLTREEWWPAHLIENTAGLYQWIGDEVEAHSDVQSIVVGKETKDGVIYKITFNNEVDNNLISRATDLIKEVAQKCIAHYRGELSTDGVDT